MDLNDLRSLVTVMSLGLFVAICVWAWSRRNQAAFAEAAQLALHTDEAALPAPRDDIDGGAR